VASPAWLDRTEYPFASRWLELPSGRLHYIDEGEGRPVVMVHGTPDWSFLWRHLVKALAPRYRCVALDNLGFGLSDRPPGSWYLPENQAANLKTLIERLGLRDITLVLHDFGGPFGLSYALEKPDNVRSLVLMNTWMWSLADDPRFRRFGWLAASRLGRYLYLQWNFSARVIMKYAGRACPRGSTSTTSSPSPTRRRGPPRGRTRGPFSAAAAGSSGSGSGASTCGACPPSSSGA
jgi:pimeloyl-ACP methyl ester carboxylesterase